MHGIAVTVSGSTGRAQAALQCACTATRCWTKDMCCLCCNMAKYCNAACQKAHWSQHRTDPSAWHQQNTVCCRGEVAKMDVHVMWTRQLSKLRRSSRQLLRHTRIVGASVVSPSKGEVVAQQECDGLRLQAFPQARHGRAGPATGRAVLLDAVSWACAGAVHGSTGDIEMAKAVLVHYKKGTSLVCSGTTWLIASGG
jgi:hypothetical protein